MFQVYLSSALLIQEYLFQWDVGVDLGDFTTEAAFLEPEEIPIKSPLSIISLPTLQISIELTEEK